MFLLPPVTIDGQAIRLPISFRTSVELANHLFGSLEARSSFPTESLAASPGLLIWACDRFSDSVAANTEFDLNRLSIWIGDSLAESLASTDADSVPISNLPISRIREAFSEYAAAIGESVRKNSETPKAYRKGLRRFLVAAGLPKPSAKSWLRSRLKGFSLTDQKKTRKRLRWNAAEIRQMQRDWSVRYPSVDLRSLARGTLRAGEGNEEFSRRLEEEKLAALKQLAYGASHEINNPLANVASRAQVLVRDESDPDRQRSLATIYQQAMRAHEMISDMMLFAHPPRMNVEPCDLGEMVASVIQELESTAADHSVSLSAVTQGNHGAIQSDLNIVADRTQLLVALKAIVTNAIEAMGTGGSVKIELCGDYSGSETVAVHIIDSGPGISEEVRRHLFDPFYSGREAGRGLGFGLSKAWRIAELHGGRLELTSTNADGTCMTLVLPRSKTSGIKAQA